MSKILVFIQQENGKLNSASLAAIKAASELKSFYPESAIVGIALGAGAKDAVSDLKTDLLEKILVSEDAVFSPYTGLPYAHALSQAVRAENAGLIVGASTSSVKDFFPALTALLDDAVMVSEVLRFVDKDTYQRPMYAGNAIAEVSTDAATRVFSVRATNFTGLELSSASAVQVQDLSVSLPAGVADYARVVKFDSSASERPDLADARIVVSGGRGVQSKEGFEKYIYPLADALGAAIGASRAAVDAGFAPNDWQVGQTGKTVAPQLYIAVGLSGAIQHIAGMKDSKVVVAINKDPEAPVFDVADYGLVADLEQAVPELIGLIKT